jgi:hypothetical protein
MTIDGALAAEACVAAGDGEGTYTIREGACRFGQPPMNNARLHHKNGKALSFTSLGILSLFYNRRCDALGVQDMPAAGYHTTGHRLATEGYAGPPAEAPVGSGRAVQRTRNCESETSWYYSGTLAQVRAGRTPIRMTIALMRRRLGMPALFVADSLDDGLIVSPIARSMISL